MNIIRASHYGMCSGVKNAIALAKKVSSTSELTILGELVHNDHVIADLKRSGVSFANSIEEITTKKVMITAHGASDSKVQKLKTLGFDVIEATCPLVKLAHKAATSFAINGYFPVIIGKHDHVEVQGIVGDLQEYAVVLTSADINSIPQREKYGILSQTTQPIGRVRDLVELIRKRFPTSEVRFTDTVCSSTKKRQSAAVDIARQSDVVIVIGGKKSNNTAELAKTCLAFCKNVYQVETAADLMPNWFVAAKTVGITAGTSTPDEIIDDVEKAIAQIAFTFVDSNKNMVACKLD